jgi:hypothetical protein
VTNRTRWFYGVVASGGLLVLWLTPTVRGWFAGLQDLLTAVIAMIAAYIAWQQWLTNTRKLDVDAWKLQLDFYERRLPIYQHVVAFLSRMIENDDFKNTVVSQFFRDTRRKLIGCSDRRFANISRKS